jgi:hypothetical protein
MLIRRKSLFTGKVNEMNLNVTAEQLTRWQNGELIQNVFPTLSVDEREFLMTGATKDEWNDTFLDS